MRVEADMSAFPSKRDRWIVAVVWLSVLAELAAGVFVWFAPGDLPVRILLTGILLASAMFSLHLLYSTAYDVSQETLTVRCSVFKWKVPLIQISSITPSRSLFSGPALSLDRLAVNYADARVPLLISPEERSKFLREIEKRCPQLTLVDESRLERTAET